MSVKVAINGFGRIGRLAFRQMFGAEGYEVVAINDLTSAKMLAHLLKYDSTQGNYVAKGHTSISTKAKARTTPSPSTARRSSSTSCQRGRAALGQAGRGRRARVHRLLHQQGKVPGAHRRRRQARSSSPHPAGSDLPTIVYNVNHEDPDQGDTIISAASCTTNCLAPMAKALNDLAPIQSGIMCTIHAYTGDQMILDGPQRKGDLRRSRAARCQHRPELHRRCQGHRPRHSGA
jgi:glyceraldehyde 3-phosphate dehydrogenase